MSMLSSKAISTLDDKVTKHSPRHVGGTSRYHITVNKCDSVHSFHRFSTHVHLTNLQLTYREDTMQGFLGLDYFWL